MASLRQELLQLVKNSRGLTDREITDALRGKSAPQQPINIAARALATRGQLLRERRAEGLIRNFPSDGKSVAVVASRITAPVKADLARADRVIE